MFFSVDASRQVDDHHHHDLSRNHHGTNRNHHDSIRMVQVNKVRATIRTPVHTINMRALT